MLKSSQRHAPRRAPARIAPRRNASPQRGRGSRRNPIWSLIIVLVVVAVTVGGVFFWQDRRARAAAELAAATPIATPDNSPSATAAPSPTPTLPVVSSGSAPGGGAPVAPNPVRQATTQPTPDITPSPATATAAPAATEASAVPAATTAATAALPSAAPTVAAGAAGADLAAFAQRMLELVNADRAAEGLQPVAWDATAALAGQLHSEEMAQFGYMSHWNMDGYGPEYRYSRAGGLDIAQENVYRLVYQWQDGRGAPIDDWGQVVADAQAALMNSPGHRVNILAPEHTHLGVGIAYNAATGNVAISQEFINRYATIEPMPRRARPGDRLVLRGTLLPGSADPLVNIAYQPFPPALTLDELNQTGAYRSAAEHLAVPPVRTDADGRFVAEYTLDKAAPPGLYHVWVWVALAGSAEPAQAVNAVIEVSE